MLPLRLGRKIAALKLLFHVNMKKRSITVGKGENLVNRTRQSTLNFVRCEFPKTEWFKKTITYQGPKYWEVLLGRLKSIENY